MGNPLARFVLRVAAWLPLTYAVWYLAAPILVWPVALLAELFTRGVFRDLVLGVEQSGAVLTFVSSLKPPKGAFSGDATAVLSVESNVLLFSFGLPMLVALILAARQPHVVRNIVVGYVVLLPFQTWGVVADFLKNVAAPETTAQAGFAGWQREAIVFCYQFGTLILPTVVPAIVWVLMHRRFLEGFAGRDDEAGRAAKETAAPR